MALIGREHEAPDPKVYLSFSGGRYRVIDQGMAVSRDAPTAQEALANVARFNLKVSDRMWDGDAGRWVMRGYGIPIALRSVDPVEGRSVGIARDEGGYTALTNVESKHFKREAAARRWLAKRGYNADGTRIR
jgi:hypothetical protein